MNRNLAARIMDLLRRRQLKGTLAKIALMLSCMAIFMITYMLVAPVLTQEWEAICGMKEHTHTDACFEEVLGELICNKTEHRHTSACLDEAGNQICGLEEHLHTKECCILASAAPDKTDKQASPLAAPVLTRKSENACGLEEHTHTDMCWDEAGDLICGQEEHSHSDACLLEKPTTVPVKPEETNHKHTDECYKEVAGEIICGMEEHTHTDVCQDETGNYVCEMQEHTHADSCFAHHKELICGMEETEKQEPKKITILTCGLKEHTHTDQCYHKAEDNEQKYICGFLTEHIHGKDCYFENGELKCTLAEHIHDETCLPAQEGPIFPKTLPEGYKEAEIFQFDSAMLTEGENNEQELEALVYIPENAFDEEVMFVPEPLAEDDDRYTDAVAQLKQASAEYNSMTAMDLSFVNSDGEPLEPNTESGPVYVRLTMPMELSEEAKLTLWHHTAEEPDAKIIAKEVKTDTAYQDGMLTVDFAAFRFSTYTLTVNDVLQAPKPEPISGIVSWGGTIQTVEFADDEDVRTWDVSKTDRRYLDIAVKINVSGDRTSVTLPYAFDGVGRTQNDNPRCNLEGITQGNWEVNHEGDDVVITIDATSGHETLDIYYRFDCWNIRSDSAFAIPCKVQKEKGESPEIVYLKGKVHTGHSVKIIPYLNGTGNSDYSFNGFGGADKQSAFISHWDSVYEKYFGLRKNEFNDTDYVYDIAPFLIEPNGQQPYDISGTFSPNNSGELVGAVYMMNSRSNPDALYVNADWKLKDSTASNKEYSFTISNEKLKIGDGENKRAAVVSNLSDSTDNKTYTLYFLVRYPKTKIQNIVVTDANGNPILTWDEKEQYKISLEADLSLTHTGIDLRDPKSVDKTTAYLYDGSKEPGGRIYWASYLSQEVESNAGLTSLKNGKSATIENSADFFCLNEARSTYNSSDKYRLEAIVDLSYLSDTKRQLKAGDYRFSGYKLSLIDAAGNWSQNGNDNTPNVGWTEDKFKTIPDEVRNETIKVYGSTSLTGNSNWTLLGEIPVADVWARDKDRAFKTSYSIDGEYVQLKVVYNSRFTTALRVGYQMELQSGILEKYDLKDATELKLTNWCNYVAYRNDSADLADFKFQRYPTDDSIPAWTNYDGTVSEVRQYDNSHPFDGYNVNTQSWDEGYSLRVFARATLGNSTDVAGMVVSQVLHNSDGSVVGTRINTDDLNPNDSYSREENVVNVSEVVYSISGIITNGANSLNDLKEHVRKSLEENSNSPYGSMKQRYYVLLPEGLELNQDPVGEHYGSEEASYLSPNSTFYKSKEGEAFDAEKDIKVVDSGQVDVPVSDVSVPGLNRDRQDGSKWVSEMYWAADGDASLIDTHMIGNRQLVTFERTINVDINSLVNDDSARFDIWDWTGKPTHFWGRGLSFSAVPKNGVGSLPAGSYQADFWCQFLSKDGEPISLDPLFQRGDVKDLASAKLDTLVYIPSTFKNQSNSGSSGSSMKLEIKDGDGIPGKPGYVKSKGEYSYPLTYTLKDSTSEDVVLWCNIEQYYDETHPTDYDTWHGIVTGVNLNGNEQVKVYVRDEWFETKDYYTPEAGKEPKKSWLTDAKYGWTEVTNLESNDWQKVKAIAFSFDGREFNTSDNSATVYINMRAPEDDNLEIVYKNQNGEVIDRKQKEPGKTEYKVHNISVGSDKHSDGEQNSWLSNYTTISTEVSPVSYELPSTGGTGMSSMYVVGMALILAAAYLIYQTLRRNRKKGRGGAA